MSTKSVTARLTCTKNEAQPTSNPDYANNSVELHAHYDKGGNEAWSKATPWGESKMHISNPTAATFFEPGAVYEVEYFKMVKQEDGSYAREA